MSKYSIEVLTSLSDDEKKEIRFIFAQNCTLTGGYLEHYLIDNEKVKNDYYVVAKYENKIVGYCILQHNYLKKDELYINQLALRKDFQHRGIGKEIYNYVIKYSKGFSSLMAHVRLWNYESLKFHDSYGFESEYIGEQGCYLFTKDVSNEYSQNIKEAQKEMFELKDIDTSKDYLLKIKPDKITMENVDTINIEDIVAFSYAYDGAMGDPGALIVALKKSKLDFYYINLVYEQNKELVQKVKKGFFKQFEEAIEKSGGWLLPELDGWRKIDEGFFNFLFVRTEYLNDFKKLAYSIDKNIFISRGLLFNKKLNILALQFDDKYLTRKTEILNKMHYSIIGGIAGDIIGSRFEFNPIHKKEFELFVDNKYVNKDGKITLGYFNDGCRFTDDTVMTLAVCKALIEYKTNNGDLSELVKKYMREFGQKYPYAGYGNRFNQWIHSDNPQPYNSYGNGSAMRISAVPYFAESIDEVKVLSKIVSEVTHNHPEGIKGAEATAVAIWLALNNCSKELIKNYIEKYYYKLDFDYDDLIENYYFDETCQGSVPQSIYAFLISNSYEDTIRTAISMGGDADTMACIAGSIAAAYYGLPEEIENKAKSFLSADLLEIVEDFDKIIN